MLGNILFLQATMATASTALFIAPQGNFPKVPSHAALLQNLGALSQDFAESLLFVGSIEHAKRKDWIIPSHKSLRSALNVADSPLQLRSRPLVVGHRGALYDELENTRESFLQCAQLGCDSVELDVFLLKDGSLIVFHGGGTDQNPGDLSDYCLNQHGVGILDLDYEQSQKLVFNPSFAEFPCSKVKIEAARIPTLEEVLLDLKPTKTQVKIELKGKGTVEPTVALVERLGMVEHCQFSSFDHELLGELRKLRPCRDGNGQYMFKTGALFDTPVPADFIQQAQAVGASEVHLRYDTCTRDRVLAIHAAGMQSMAWLRGPVGMKSDVADQYWDIGNEDESCYQAIIDSGVQQLCVNRPDVLLQMLNRAY
jgi:glycerophosphoryl diester phosphodiesterase